MDPAQYLEDVKAHHAFSHQHNFPFYPATTTQTAQAAPLPFNSPVPPYFAPLLPPTVTIAPDDLAELHQQIIRRNMASIPLHCNICPKKPDFSDVSHLLTHIASKGHLSHYYKLKVRSSTDPDIRQLVEEYDQWYAEWSVEDLMSERMSLKDNKKRTRARASTRVAQPVNRTATTRRRNKGGNFDPRLTDRAIKAESIKSEARPTPPLGSNNTIPHQQAYTSMAQMWTQPQQNTHSHSLRSSSRRGYGSYGENSSPTKTYGLRRRAAPPPAPVPPRMDPDDEEVEKQSEVTKLKGVLWPGMNIFDSATPEMRRKRNQKKDVSVVEQLESNSMEVECTERVWSPSGNLQRSKFITGLPSSSPLKQYASPKKLRADTSERPPLFDLNVNSNRPAPVRNNKRRLVEEHDTYQDDQLELELNYGLPPKRKRAFNIFQDHQDHQEVSFARPAPMTFLTAEFQYPTQQQEVHNPSPYGYRTLNTNDPFRFETHYEERAQYRADSYFDDKENYTNGLYGTQPAFCTTAATYPTTQYYQHILPHEYASLYTDTHVQNAFHGYPQYVTNDGAQVEDDDPERTITAPPSDT